ARHNDGWSAASACDDAGRAAFLFVIGSAAARAAEQPAEQAAARIARRLHVAAALLDHRLRFGIALHRLTVGGNEHGLAVGEQAGERAAAHARPVAHRSGIDVDPRRRADGIEADATLLHAHGDV